VLLCIDASTVGATVGATATTLRGGLHMGHGMLVLYVDAALLPMPSGDYRAVINMGQGQWICLAVTAPEPVGYWMQ
jgi:hypothetical protein